MSPRPLDGLRKAASRVGARAVLLWRNHPRETVGAGTFGLVAAAAIAASSFGQVSQPQRPQAAPPAPPPMIVRAIAPDQAVKLNAEMPVAAGPNPAAAPFVFKGNATARS